MPCYDSRNEPTYILKEAKKEWRHNSDVAGLLCEAMVHLRYIEDLSPELKQWWAEHQARDGFKPVHVP